MERSDLREFGYRMSAVTAVVLVLCAGRFGPLWLLAAAAPGWVAWQLRPSAEDREERRRAQAEERELRPRKSALQRDLIILFWLVLLSPVIFFGGWALLLALGAKP